jgi:hypothetical protein
MITLDATLKTAQDGISHRPIVEIISSPAASVIPLRGNYFNTSSDPESDPNIIETSDGRLIMVAIQDGDLQYYYTDTDRISWNVVANLCTSWTITDVSVCELVNGNIGIVMTIYSAAEWSIKYMIVTPTGSIVTSAQNIIGAQANWLSAAHVITLANDTYLLVYAEGTGSPPSESNTYYLQKRTSSNFTSWSAASAITLTGLFPTKYKNNPNLLQLSGGRIFLHFDYMNQLTNDVEINNPYYCYSDDNGSSWSTPVKITDYDELGIKGLHPAISEKANGDLTFTYNEEVNVKTLDSNMTGFSGLFSPYGLDFNQTDKKLYVWGGVPGNQIVDIDTDLWLYERVYDATTSPAHPNIQETHPGAGRFSVSQTEGVLTVINHNTETITRYRANTDAGGMNYNFQANTDVNRPVLAMIRQTETQNQLWIVYVHGWRDTSVAFGWIDLDEVVDPITGMYTWNELYTGITIWSAHFNMVKVQYIESENILMFNGHSHFYHDTRGIVLLTLDGAVIKHYTENNYPNFPTHGAFSAVYYNNYIYFSFKYHADQPDKRGLGCINLNDDSMVFFVPTWVSTNDYYLENIMHMEGTTKLLMTCGVSGSGGVVIFDTSDSSWTIYNNDTLPGLVRPGCDDSSWGYISYTNHLAGNCIAYDPSTKNIYVCHTQGDGTCAYIVSFSEYGNFSTLKYSTVFDPDITPTYSETADLSLDDYEDQAIIVIDSDDILWAVWRHMHGNEYSIQWANAVVNKDLSNYLSLETSIKIVWDIDRPAKLMFNLSHGHILDPQNLLSTYSVYLKKGRELTVRFGETVSSVDYWQNQGTFIVAEQQLSYTTDKYPDMRITAEDMRCLWEDNLVVASEYFSAETPKYILETILPAHAGLESGNMDISAFTGTHDIYHQYIDMTVEDMVKSLLDHFMYYPFVSVDGKFEPRHLNIEKAVDHTYSDLTQITKYTPDGKYSTFINRVVVTGLSHNYQEVLYEEEVIGRVSGTTGWWGKKEDDVIWYSENHTKTCRYPRLEVIQSTSEFSLFSAFGGGKESITDVDSDEKYCVITTTAPNMVPTLVALIAVCVATYTACKGTCDGGPHKTGWCSFCNFAMVLELNAIISILAGIASYNYNVWGRPIGYEKQSHQAEANDYDFQAELNGKVVTEQIDDPYCYTIALCQKVADQEMDVITSQRNRHKFTKTAHLQDELGDIVNILHPYSGETLTTMIVKLTREMKIGQYFLDHIEGWRLT